jgi:UDP-N-acetylglucosamine--dolichyl-phosphate N-acetylglucosaminephosphotransferase
MDLVIPFCMLVSFLASWVTTKKWICKAPEVGILGLDMNKPGRPKVPEMGGICVILGFGFGMLIYIGTRTFFFDEMDYVPILAVLCTVLITCIVGMMDDLLGWKKGLSQWQKPIFVLFAAMPIMVINAGHTTMNIPFVGTMNWGILYPLLIIPIGIIGASNVYNMVAGYNGLEAGMGIIILTTLGYYAFINGEKNAIILSLCMDCALLAFLYFNWYPAKVFPGDTMTYSVGALAACVSIIGNEQRIAIILFVPYAIDFLLQIRSRFRSEAFAEVNVDGSLEKPSKDIYHLTHLALAMLKRAKGKVYERDVVLFVYVIELMAVGLNIHIYNKI